MTLFSRDVLDKEIPQWLGRDDYHVVFLTCPLPFPFSFAVHPWVLTVNHDKVDRWEVWQKIDPLSKTNFGHVYHNYFSPLSGVRRSYITRECYSPVIIGGVSGDEDSLAAEIVKFVNTNAPRYQYTDKYRYYPGPNSNTFIQWVLDQFPDVGIQLPSNALGKKYRY